MDKKKVEYFVLEPVSQPGTRFYIPTQNQAALAKLQPLLTPQMFEELLRSEKACRDIWIEDDNQRKLQYRALLSSADRAGIICMIRTLRKHKTEQIASGRKFHLSDENFLREAEKLLIAELSLVLDIPAAEADIYIEKLLEN